MKLGNMATNPVLGNLLNSIKSGKYKRVRVFLERLLLCTLTLWRLLAQNPRSEKRLLSILRGQGASRVLVLLKLIQCAINPQAPSRWMRSRACASGSPALA